MGTKIDRRDFLALMGMSGAAAVTVGCGQPKDYYQETWHPWTENVEGDIPYVPRYYATTCSEADGCGLWVKVVDGRAIKIEGNPEHPINQGSSTAPHQAVIQGMYSSDRIREPFQKGHKTTWREANALFHEKLKEHEGKNIYALTGPITGSVESLWTRFVSEMGAGRHIPFQPFSQSDFVMASEKVFGLAAVPMVSLEGTDYICSLGAQFLETWGDVTANMRHFGKCREVDHGKRAKHVQFEAKVTGTGANADEVLPAKPGSETLIALALLKEVGVKSTGLTAEMQAKIAALTGGVSVQGAATAAGLKADQISHVAEELVHANSAVVLPAEGLGLGQDAIPHHMAILLLNKALGGIGKHINYTNAKPIERVPSHKPVADLIEDMNAGKVDMLIVKGANPSYALPEDAGFREALTKVGFVVVFADSINEMCQFKRGDETYYPDLILPTTHELESWGEINTYTGMDMLMQPVMRPRWPVKQAEDQLIEAMNALGKTVDSDFQGYLKTEWLAKFDGDERLWRESLQKGGRFEIAESGEDLPVSGNLTDNAFAGIQSRTSSGATLVLVTSARLGDGSSTNRGWLQELPDTMTGLVWDSWAEIGQEFADSQGLSSGDVVTVQANGQSLDVSVFVVDTIHGSVVALATGQGHESLGPEYNRGINAFAFLDPQLNEAEVYGGGPMVVTLNKTGKRERMATIHIPGKGDRIHTQLTGYQEKDKRYNRDLYQSVAVSALGHGGGGHGAGHGADDEKLKDSRFPRHNDDNFYPDRKTTPVVVGRSEKFYDDYKWELGIDLNKCTGCGSCVTACYAENNLPVVGKDQVIKGREMAWLRINRYLSFTKKDGETKTEVGFLPMMCQQCANAPCESVCPSLATYHSKEGLNAMVYNRCVGTRYCSNNCSYKVRRFNWFTFPYEGDQNWQFNPDVSVRTKGVMEKCTFCVQKIRAAKYKAKDENRKVADGEAKTACQQACPAEAMAFGNYSDHDSAIYHMAHDERAYRALDHHIHTKPGVTYLKRVTLDQEHHG